MDKVERVAEIAAGVDDPAYALPLPPTWALDEAARHAGFAEWFMVPSMFRTPTNRWIIVEARKAALRALQETPDAS